MAIPFSATDNHATIGATEFSLPTASTTLTAQTTACTMQAFIDFSAMAAGDQFRVQIYESVNGGSQKLACTPSDLVGVQSSLFVTPILMVKNGWNVTVKKIAGTDRDVPWDLKMDTGDRNVAAVSNNAITAAAIATDAITSAQLAASAVTEIAAGILAAVYEGSRTVQDFFRLGAAVLWGKASGLEGATMTYRDDADAKNRIVETYSTGARAPTTRDAT